MTKANTSQRSGQKCISSSAHYPRQVHKNRYTRKPLANLDYLNDDNIEEINKHSEEVKQKIPALYIYEIDDYIAFLDNKTPIIVQNLNINNKNIFLKLNLSTVDDYRKITKY